MSAGLCMGGREASEDDILLPVSDPGKASDILNQVARVYNWAL